jgi:diguanylate cyclase (GGDEF)-like protein/PAS domain S-box-containing protein
MSLVAESLNVDESQRLAALHRLHLLHTSNEPEFRELVELAAAICGTPIGLMTLLDETHQWYKASTGLGLQQSPRSVAFCNYTIQQSDVLIVPDAQQDPRFSSNPLVNGNPHIRFYAGFPISSSDGYALGSLCVIDQIPRHLDDNQLNALRVLARQINARLELREQRTALQDALRATEAARDRLAISEGRFQTFMDSSPFLSYLKDPEGRVIFHNRSLARTLGIDREDILGLTDFDLWPHNIATELRSHELAVLRTGQLQEVNEVSINPDGSDRHWRSYKFPCLDDDGTMLLGGVSIDLTEEMKRDAQLRLYQAELEAANERLRELATTDPLTGLLNRRAFEERLTIEFAHAHRSGHPLSLLIFDLDNFKQCNDRHGHSGGDRTLCCFAEILRQTLRPNHILVRYGGEEFIALLPNTDECAAMHVGDRILEAVRQATWPFDPVTVSAGCSSLTPATPTKDRLVTLADEALYVAKRAGKNRIVSYGSYFNELLNTMHKQRGSRPIKSLQPDV